MNFYLGSNGDFPLFTVIATGTYSWLGTPWGLAEGPMLILWLQLCCSVDQSCLALCDPVDCSTPSSPVLHHLPEFAETFESMMPSNHLVLCHPLLLLPSILPRIRVFPSDLALRIRWPKYWSFSLRISPSSEQTAAMPALCGTCPCSCFSPTEVVGPSIDVGPSIRSCPRPLRTHIGEMTGQD